MPRFNSAFHPTAWMTFSAPGRYSKAHVDTPHGPLIPTSFQEGGFIGFGFILVSDIKERLKGSDVRPPITSCLHKSCLRCWDSTALPGLASGISSTLRSCGWDWQLAPIAFHPRRRIAGVPPLLSSSFVVIWIYLNFSCGTTLWMMKIWEWIFEVGHIVSYQLTFRQRSHWIKTEPTQKINIKLWLRYGFIHEGVIDGTPVCNSVLHWHSRFSSDVTCSYVSDRNGFN